MAAPNLIGATTITGKTTGANLTTTTTTTVLDNPAASGKCLKINTLNACNYSATAANITISFHDAANSAGTQYRIVGVLSVPGYSTLNVIDKTSQYYLAEDNSISAIAGTANRLIITVSYEDIS